MRHASQLLAVFLLMIAALSNVYAERADRDKPIHVEADAVRIDDLKKLAIYEGKVILSQGSLRVQADRIEVRQDADGFLTGVATGRPVHFRQRLEGRGEWVEAWANRVEYDARRELVRLIGEAYLKKGEEELRGELITYDARNEVYQALGGLSAQKPGRVRAVILPPQREGGAGTAGSEAAPVRPGSGQAPSP